MAVDALEPGPNNTYPHFPRRLDGTPLWSDTAATDGIQVDGRTPMPRGIRSQDGVPIDMTPRTSNGTAINPPTLLP